MTQDNILGARGPMIDPTKYPMIKCDKCGHHVFRSATVIYNVPGIAIGNGTEDFPYSLPVLICDKCGEIVKYIRDEINKIENDKNENISKGSQLIL